MQTKHLIFLISVGGGTVPEGGRRSVFHSQRKRGQQCSEAVCKVSFLAYSQKVMYIEYDYLRTGYVWEQYNDRTGEGQGCKPFTGWSALTVLMMGETF